MVDAAVPAQAEPVELPVAGGYVDRRGAVVGGEAVPGDEPGHLADVADDGGRDDGPTPKIPVRVVPLARTATASQVIARAQAEEAEALLAAVAARAEAAEAVAESQRIQSAAAAAAVRTLITAGLVEEAAAHEAVTALATAGLIVAAAGQAAAEVVAEDAAAVEAAGEATAASLAESLATIASADEVAAEATGEAEARIKAASITMAEAQVLRYLPKPLPFSVIADTLGISRSAAKERAARLYRRLGVHSRDEAISQARSLDLIRG